MPNPALIIVALATLGALAPRSSRCPRSDRCCAPCHFAWEERELLPHLPETLRRELLRQHGELRRAGMPPTMLDAHAMWEDVALAPHLPAHLSERLRASHREMGH